jgi:hypothetical protein
MDDAAVGNATMFEFYLNELNDNWKGHVFVQSLPRGEHKLFRKKMMKAERIDWDWDVYLGSGPPNWLFNFLLLLLFLRLLSRLKSQKRKKAQKSQNHQWNSIWADSN